MAGGSDGGVNEAGRAAAEAALQEAERQVQLEAIIAEAVAADGWRGDFKKNVNKRAEHVKAYIEAIKAGPKDQNIAKNAFRGSKKDPVFKDSATAKSFDDFLKRIDAIIGMSKKVEQKVSAPEPVSVAPEPALDKTKEAEAEFRSLQDQFSASVRGYAKQDKTFRSAPDARLVTEYWLRAKRSGIDVQAHPFFDRPIGDKVAFAAFADSIDDLDKRRIKAKNDAGGNWRMDFGKGPRANDRFEETIDSELVAARVRAIEGFADQEMQALGEQAVFAKLDADARKAKLKPIVELLATEKRAATDDEAKSLVGETGLVEEMKALLWELGHIEIERERVKAVFQSVRDGSKKKEEAALAEAEAVAKAAAQDTEPPLADSALASSKPKAHFSMPKIAVVGMKQKSKAAKARKAAEASPEAVTTAAEVDLKKATESPEFATAVQAIVNNDNLWASKFTDHAAREAHVRKWIAGKVGTMSSVVTATGRAWENAVKQAVQLRSESSATSSTLAEAVPAEASPATPEKRPEDKINDLVGDLSVWRQQVHGKAAVREDAVRKVVGILDGSNPYAGGIEKFVEDEIPVLKDHRRDFITRVREIAGVPDAAAVAVPANPDLLKTPEQMRTEIEADIAKATTAADVDAFFDKIAVWEKGLVTDAEKALVEQAANDKWRELAIKDVNSLFIDVLNQTTTVEEAKALLPRIDGLQAIWGFGGDFRDKLIKEVNRVVRYHENPPPALQPLPPDPFDAAPPVPDTTDAAPLPSVDTGPTPEQEAAALAAEARVRELIEQSTGRDGMSDIFDIINAHADDGTLDRSQARALWDLANEKWESVGTPKEKAVDRLAELERELAERKDEINFGVFADGLDPEKQRQDFVDLVNGDIGAAALIAKGVVREGVTAERVHDLAKAFASTYREKEKAEKAVAAAAKAEQPSIFAKIGGWFKRKPKTETPPIDAAPTSPDNVKAADLLKPAFWSRLGEQAIMRSGAYLRGELTESERQGEEQAWGWAAARLGTEVATTIFGVRVIAEQSRYHYTHKEYKRLAEAMAGAYAPEQDAAGAEVAASVATAEARIRQALDESNHLSEAKRAELVPKLKASLDKLEEVKRWHSEKAAEAEQVRNKEIARLLDEALELRVKDIARRREAANTLFAMATFGTAHLAGAAAAASYNFAWRAGRSGMYMLAGNLERAKRLQYERVRGGDLNEASLDRLMADQAVAVGRGFKENVRLLSGGGWKNWKEAKALNILGNWGLAALTIGKYYGLTHAYAAAEASGTEHAEAALKAAETHAVTAMNQTPNAEHAEVASNDGEAHAVTATVETPTVEMHVDSATAETPVVAGTAVDVLQPHDAVAEAMAHHGETGAEIGAATTPDSVAGLTADQHQIAYEQPMSFGNAHSVIVGAENVATLATVEAWDTASPDNVMHSTVSGILANQIEHAGPDVLKDMGFHGDPTNAHAVHLFALKEGYKIAAENGYGDKWLTHDSIGKTVILTNDAPHYYSFMVTASSPEEQTAMFMDARVPHVDHPHAEALGGSVEESVDLSSESIPDVSGGTPETPEGVTVPEPTATQVAQTAAVAQTPEAQAAAEFMVNGHVVEPPPGAYSEAELAALSLHAHNLERVKAAEEAIWQKYHDQLGHSGKVYDTTRVSQMEKVYRHVFVSQDRQLAVFLNKMDHGNRWILGLNASGDGSNLLGTMTDKQIYELAFDKIDYRVTVDNVNGPMDNAEWKEFHKAVVDKVE